MGAIDLNFIQENDESKYPLILQDSSDRNDPDDVIDYDTITSIQIDFIASETESLSENKTFTINSDSKGKNTGTVDVSGSYVPFVFNLEISYLGGTIYTLSGSMPTFAASEVVTLINGILTSAGLNSYIEAATDGTYVWLQTVGTGSGEYFTIHGGTALTTLGWTTGTFRGNGINFSTVTQEDFKFYIYPEDFGEGWSAIPEQYWKVEFTTIHTDTVLITSPYESELLFFTTKQSEIYLANRFRYIANNFNELQRFQDGFLTPYEIFVQKTDQYKIRIEALYQAIIDENTTIAAQMRDYLVNFKLLNQIPS